MKKNLTVMEYPTLASWQTVHNRDAIGAGIVRDLAATAPYIRQSGIAIHMITAIGNNTV